MTKILVALTVAACTAPTHDTDPDAIAASSPDASLDARTPLALDARPDTAAPDAAASPPPHALVILLHGAALTGAREAVTWHLSAAPADVVTLAPESTGNVWNASRACCDVTLAQPDEADLVQLVTARIAQGDIDPARVYVWGHSNGAVMVWRLLCDHAELFRAGVALEGADNSATDAACAPSRPLHILRVHGTADPTVSYALPGSAYPGMPDQLVPAVGPLGSADQDGVAASCTGPFVQTFAHQTQGIAQKGGNNNAAGDVDGFTRPCAGVAELWRSNGGEHSPLLSDEWFADVLAWSETHR